MKVPEKNLRSEKCDTRNTYILRSNKERYKEYDNIGSIMRKKRLTFGHQKRMDLKGLAKKVLNEQEDGNIRIPWIKEVHRNSLSPWTEVGVEEEQTRETGSGEK